MFRITTISNPPGNGSRGSFDGCTRVRYLVAAALSCGLLAFMTACSTTGSTVAASASPGALAQDAACCGNCGQSEALVSAGAVSDAPCCGSCGGITSTR